MKDVDYKALMIPASVLGSPSPEPLYFQEFEERQREERHQEAMARANERIRVIQTEINRMLFGFTPVQSPRDAESGYGLSPYAPALSDALAEVAFRERLTRGF